MSPNPNRIEWVDAAKGMGIILVVYAHVARGLNKSGIFDGNAFEIVDAIIYSFHMPLFFFLSGIFYLRTMEKRGFTGTIFSKINTIIYPYIIWSLIQGFIEVQLSAYTNGAAQYSDLFAILWQPRAHFWFLYTLFFMFIATSLILIPYFKNMVSTKITLLSGLAITLFIYLSRQHSPDVFALTSVSSNAIYFMGGVVFSAVAPNYKRIRLVGLISAVSFFLLSYVVNVAHTLPSNDLWKLSLAFFGILAVIYMCRVIPESIDKPFALLGSYSMIIYLLHILFGSGVRIVLSKGFSVDSSLLHLFVGTTIGLIGPIMFYLIVKNTVLISLFRPLKPQREIGPP